MAKGLPKLDYVQRNIGVVILAKISAYWDGPMENSQNSIDTRYVAIA